MNKFKKCTTCQYRESKTYPWACNYFSIVGHRRDCEPGNACIKYKKGKRIVLNKVDCLKGHCGTLDIENDK